MRKFMKNLVVIFCSIIFVVILGVIALLIWVDPNNLKTPMEKAIHHATGQNVSIQGDINWTFFPVLSLEANQINVPNPQGFSKEAMLQLEQAIIRIRISPLLTGNIHANQIKLRGLNLFAETLSNGKNNWDTLLALPKNNPPLTQSVPSKNEHKKPATLVLHLTNINITDSHLHWKNEQHHSEGKIKLKELSLENLNTSNAPFTFNAQARFSNKTHKHIPLTVSSRNQFDGEKNILNINYKVNVNKSITGEGDLTVNLKDTMPFEGKFKMNSNVVQQVLCSLNGDENVVNFKDCNITHDNNHLNANMSLNNWQHPKKTTVQGNVHADALQLQAIKIQNMDSTIKMTNNRWQFNPISATLYQGHYQGQLTIDAKASVPTYQLKQKMTGVQLQPLLRDLNKKQAISGALFSHADLQSQGKNIDTIKHNLNGRVHFTINDGDLHGVDITRFAENTYTQFMKKGKTKKVRDGTTHFSKVSADFKLNDNMAYTQNLTLSSSLLRVIAEGNLNLVNNKIYFNANANLHDNPILPQVSIPFLITGTLGNPSIQPDLTGLAKIIDPSKLGKEIGKNIDNASKQLNKVGDGIDKQLKSIFN